MGSISLGIAGGHQKFTGNKKKGEGVEGKKRSEKNDCGLQGWAGPEA